MADRKMFAEKVVESPTPQQLAPDAAPPAPPGKTPAAAGETPRDDDQFVAMVRQIAPDLSGAGADAAAFWFRAGYMAAPRTAHAEADVVVWTDTVVNGVPLNITTRGTGDTDAVALAHLEALRRLAGHETVRTFGVAQPLNRNVTLLKGETKPQEQPPAAASPFSVTPDPEPSKAPDRSLPGETYREATVIRKDVSQSGTPHLALVDASGDTVGRVFFGKKGRTPMERLVYDLTPDVRWNDVPVGFSVPGKWRVILRQSSRVNEQSGKPYWDVVGIDPL